MDKQVTFDILTNDEFNKNVKKPDKRDKKWQARHEERVSGHSKKVDSFNSDSIPPFTMATYKTP